jgi:hypothetical protein
MTRSAGVSAEVEANLNKPMVYVDDEGRSIYRASALGQCTSAFIYVRAGFEPMAPPPAMQRRFDEGHLHEANIIQRLNTEHGIEVFNREREVTMWITSTLGIRGHIDGEGVGNLEADWADGFHPTAAKHRLVENKTMSQKAFAEWVELDWDARWRKYPGYAMQITVLGEAAGFDEVIYAVKNKESGEILVEITPTAVYPLLTIKQKVLGIEAHVRQGQPMPDECDIRSYPCPVFYVGPCGDTVERQELEEREAEVVVALAKTYDANRAAEAAAKKAKETARDEIKKHIPDGGPFEVEGWKINYTVRELKGTEVVESFDMDAFAAAHPELVEEFTTTKEVEKWSQERVNVTPPKDAGWS